MMRTNRNVVVVSGVFFAFFFYWLFFSGDRFLSSDEILSGIPVHPVLQESTHALGRPETPTVVKVTDGVYVAVGFSTGNSILIEGSDQLIIVDSAESVDAAKEILKEFRKITMKPIKAIVYTHSHYDHIFGARGLVEDVNNPPEIWAHHSFKSNIIDAMSVGTKVYRGTVHQFGLQLGDYLVSPFKLRIDSTAPLLPLFPTRFVNDSETIHLPGLKVTLLYMPGETSDQVLVWLPDKRVLLTGDNIYECFPNVYAIRGVPPRSSVQWADAIRRMRSLQADYLVVSHGFPVLGREVIYDILTVYMLGIRYVHDQTLRYINKGFHPDVISKLVRLPSSLASHPYLLECYGMTSFVSKGIYEEYLGWFSGDPVELQPLTPYERADRLIEWVEETKLLMEAEKALNGRDFQWSLELSSIVFKIQPENSRAKQLRLEALRGLAGEQTNALARNYYMTSALDDNNLVDWNVDQSDIIEKLDMSALLNLMRFRLKAEDVNGVNMSILIHFTNNEETYRLQILYSILTVDEITEGQKISGKKEEKEEEEGIDAKLVTTSKVWREIIMKKRSAVMAYASGEVHVEGNVMKLRQFLSYF